MVTLFSLIMDTDDEDSTTSSVRRGVHVYDPFVDDRDGDLFVSRIVTLVSMCKAVIFAYLVFFFYQDYQSGSWTLTSTVEVASFLLLEFLMNFVMALGSAVIMLCLALVVLTAVYCFNDLAFCGGSFSDWYAFFLPTKRSPTTTVTIDEEQGQEVGRRMFSHYYEYMGDNDNHNDDYHDNRNDNDHDCVNYDDGGVQDMDWEPTPDPITTTIGSTDEEPDHPDMMEWAATPEINFFSMQGTSTSNTTGSDYHDRTTTKDKCRLVKSKSRIVYVLRRSNPRYWSHPLLMFVEYQAASKIRSPGRSFVPAGRALTTIPEGVHFLPQFVSSTHIVPRDGHNEIARGRRIDDSDIDSRTGSLFFLAAGRAFVHFLKDCVSLLSTGIVPPRDNPTEIAQACRIAACEIDSPTGNRFFLPAGRAFVHILTKLASTLHMVRFDGPIMMISDCEIDPKDLEGACEVNLDRGDVPVQGDGDDDDDDHNNAGCDDHDESLRSVHDGDDTARDDHDGDHLLSFLHDNDIVCHNHDGDLFSVDGDDHTFCGDHDGDLLSVDDGDLTGCDDHDADILSDNDGDDTCCGDHTADLLSLHDDDKTCCDGHDRQVTVLSGNDDDDDKDKSGPQATNDDVKKENGDISSHLSFVDVAIVDHADAHDDTLPVRAIDKLESKKSQDVAIDHGIVDRAVADFDFVPERLPSCACVEEVTRVQVVQVPPIRRSTRLAERQRRQLFQQGQLNINTTLDGGVSAPIPIGLGSIFVDGRRRSARLLSIKPRDNTKMTGSGRSQRSQRSRCSRT